MIGSVVRQVYDNWELCIADDRSTADWVRPMLEAWKARDARIKVNYREANGHISEATNSAFTLVTATTSRCSTMTTCCGPHALAEVALAIADIQTRRSSIPTKTRSTTADAASIRISSRRGIRCCSASQNYLNHLTVHRAENIRRVGGWRSDFIGSQDYDINLRVVSLTGAAGIVHIPKILYHWRATETRSRRTTAEGLRGQQCDEGPHRLLDGTNISGEIVQVPETTWHRIRFGLPDERPLVSLIIPTKNCHEILRVCIDSIKTRTTYPNYEIIIVDNASDDPDSLAYFTALESDGTARVLRYDSAVQLSPPSTISPSSMPEAIWSA